MQNTPAEQVTFYARVKRVSLDGLKLRHLRNHFCRRKRPTGKGLAPVGRASARQFIKVAQLTHTKKRICEKCAFLFSAKYTCVANFVAVNDDLHVKV
ncbi:hypothetical protein D9981_20320 [Pseudoalteromonas phenolica O-BC30]|uniref:Uncharacterized protein n=1 Tax=Pseudoalteromonas phenolica TaxID=161398 RepID=A0A0S2K6S2_9GAMM|nr:hypothetical protein PP2015_3314 [Pseudoalteromonas phenolica]RXE93804.1 hypothetical protein D9981_20320 [Pseudoalteromonas phenolica O-BC30]